MMQVSLTEESALKVAIDICNDPELKREFLCVPGSNYCAHTSRGPHNLTIWCVVVENKATEILENLCIPKHLQEKVTGIVLPIGMRMLNWARYHKRTLGISRKYSVNFLNNSFFTQLGIIDNKKAAEELIKDKSLNIKQKYKLACLYCFEEHILALYRQMTEKEKEEFYDANNPMKIKQPGLVKFWSYYQMDEIDKLKEEKNLDQYRLEMAVESGSKAAVEYCLEKTSLRGKKDAIIDAAIGTVSSRMGKGFFEGIGRYEDRGKLLVPSEFYTDILHSLLSKMRDDQKIEFLKKEIDLSGNYRYSRTLGYFLNWPYWKYFMETAELMWEFLPEHSYGDSLENIYKRISSGKDNLWRLDGESFYRKLLKDFWKRSPVHYKRYVLSDKESIHEHQYGRVLLFNLFGLNNFNNEDRENIELILEDATEKEREDIIFSFTGGKICSQLIQEEKWNMLNMFVQKCCPKEKVHKLMETHITSRLLDHCLYFIYHDNWKALGLFIKWISLTEEEIINELMKSIYCSKGRNACLDLISPHKKLKAINQFIIWCVPSEEANLFKKVLGFSHEGAKKCANLVIAEEQELVSEFIHFCLSSEEDVRDFKEYVAYATVDDVCKRFISDYSRKYIYDEQDDEQDDERESIESIEFQGGKWEEVEKFLTLCFSSEEEIAEFKKNALLEASGVEIHSKLIFANRWEDAETFFAWLGLSAEEIKKLKKETLFNNLLIKGMFEDLMYGEPGKQFHSCGSNQDAIELFLRWFLTDKQTILEFRDKFKDECRANIEEEKYEATIEKFDMMIEERLNDLN